MSIAKELVDLARDAASLPVLRERILLLKEKVEMLEKEVKQLKKEKILREKENADLKNQVLGYSESEEFVEHRGALFKKKPGGGYHLAVYCPNCHKSTSNFERNIVFRCSSCDWCSSFKGDDFKKVFMELS